MNLHQVRWLVSALCLVTGLAFVAGQAKAAPTVSMWSTVVPNGTAAIEYVSGGANIIDGVSGPTFVGRTFGQPAASAIRGALVTETYPITLGGGAINITRAATVSAGALANAAVATYGVYTAGAAGFAIGTAVADYFGLGTACLPSQVTGTLASGWKCDPGQATQTFSTWIISDPRTSTNVTTTDRQARCDSFAGVFNGNTYFTTYYPPGQSIPGIGGSGAQGACAWKIGTNGTLRANNYTAQGTSQGCPATIDFFNPIYSTTAGSPPGPDGKCRTGNYTAVLDSVVASRLAQYADSTKAPAMAQDLLNKGVSLPADTVISGPASKPLTPTVTTQNNPDGSVVTTTKTPTANYTYNQPNNITVTTTNVTVTNTTNNGVTTTTTTTENAPPESTPIDTALGPVPNLYDRKYPNGMQGVWDAKYAAIKDAPVFATVGSLMPSNIGSTGQCPSWNLPLDLGPWNYGTANVAPPCWVWDFGAAVIVISALLLARALIFGG